VGSSLNRKTTKNKKSQYIGVTINNEGLIIAYANINGKRKHLGVFKTEEEAAKVRDKAIIGNDRNYCTFNFPQ
jgi:hypothetical protein